MDLSGVGGPLLDMLSNKKNSQVIMILHILNRNQKLDPLKSFCACKIYLPAGFKRIKRDLLGCPGIFRILRISVKARSCVPSKIA